MFVRKHYLSVVSIHYERARTLCRSRKLKFFNFHMLNGIPFLLTSLRIFLTSLRIFLTSLRIFLQVHAQKWRMETMLYLGLYLAYNGGQRVVKEHLQSNLFFLHALSPFIRIFALYTVYIDHFAFRYIFIK